MIRGYGPAVTWIKPVLTAARSQHGYSSTQTTLPLAWLQNWICPVHRSIRCRPIDEETTCHRNSTAIDTTMINTATMTVIEECFFMLSEYALPAATNPAH